MIHLDTVYPEKEGGREREREKKKERERRERERRCNIRGRDTIN